MTTFNPYLHFRGNTEEAFLFYQSIFGGEFTKIARFGDLPASEDFPIDAAHHNKIMHIELPLNPHNVLMGADALLDREGEEFQFGDNFHIAVGVSSKAEADRLFSALSEKGTIEMPIQDSPWGSYFGMLKDRFKVQWTVDFDLNEQ